MSILGLFQKELKDISKKALIRPILALIIASILFIIFVWNHVPEFWYTIPIAIVSVVITAFLFEAPGFRSFLQQTALEVVQDKKYLEMLNTDNLEKMLRKIHQAYYGIPDEVERGNLYDYVKEHILKYLGEPYEENVEIEYDLYKRTGYVEIQLHRKFTIVNMREKDRDDTRNIIFNVTQIPKQNDEFHFPFDKWSLKVDGVEVGFPEQSKRFTKGENVLKFRYEHPYRASKLSPAKIEYKIIGNECDDEKLIHQTFPLPTKGFKLRITVNDFQDCSFWYKFSGSVEPTAKQLTIGDRKFILDYDGWMIPGNTITVYYKPKTS